MLILKLGGSAITKKEGYMAADRKTMASLASAIAGARRGGLRGLVIVHGAGSFGHAPVLKYNLNNGVHTQLQKKGCRITQKACARLSSLVVSSLEKKGVAAISIPPHEIIRSKGRRIKKLDSARINAALHAGKVPVLYGDMVPDSALGFSVCSGDQIVSHLAKKAKRVVLATNVDGVLAGGKVVAEINRRNFARIKGHLRASGSPDVTGGMAGKIAELLSVCAPCYIVNAKKPSRVKALLLGKKALSTKVKF
ncbi:MAG: isopentenyl phosphate kinase [Candidatus Micrarchaeia archaeon]